MTIAGILFVAYLNYRSDSLFRFMCYASLLAGLFLEICRVTQKWKTVLVFVIVSSLLSMFFWEPNVRGVIGTNGSLWPVAFCILFTIMVITYFEKTFIPQLTEGMVMLQSIGITYWIVDLRLWEFKSGLLACIIAVPAFISSLSLLHAFSKLDLDWSARLGQSIWSALVMLAFATDNFWGLIFGSKFDGTQGVGEVIYFLAKYFFTGVSLIYVVQSLFLFIPRDDEQSPTGTIDLVKLHIDRLSPEQANKKHAILALGYASLVFGINYSFNIMPRQLAIWSVFVTFPMILSLFVRFVEKPGLNE